MANERISELAVDTLDGSELVPVVQGGTVTMRTTTQDIADLAGGTTAPLAPLDITGCVVLLDANDLEGLEVDDPIPLWANTGEGGSDYDATAETDEEPYYRIDAETGLPVAHFPNIADIGDTIDIVAVNQGAKSFTIADGADYSDVVVIGQKIIVSGSTGNDGTYTIASASYNNDPGAPQSTFVVVEAVPSAVADGALETPTHYMSILGAGLDLFQNVEALTIAGISSLDQGRSATIFWSSDGDGNGLIRASLFDTNISAANNETGDGYIAAGGLIGGGPMRTTTGLSGVLGSANFLGTRPSALFQASGQPPIVQFASVDSADGPGPSPNTPSNNICIGATEIEHFGRQGAIHLICTWRRFLNDAERAGLLAYFEQRLA